MSDLQPLDFPQAYRGLTLNRHRNAAGAEVAANRLRTIRVDRFDFSKLQVRDQREPRNLISGGDLGDATETFRYVSLGGTIIAPSGSALQDDIGSFLQTFSIEECQLASPATRGILPFTYTVPTDIPGYAPHQLERLLCRPAGVPVVSEARSRGFARAFALELVCEDPRRYRDAETSIVLAAGNGFSASCPNWNAAVGRYVWPLITVRMAGAGAANFTLSSLGVSLVLNLAGAVNLDSIAIEPEFGLIRRNSVHAAALRTSAVNSFFGIPRGGATVSATNTANVTDVTIAYRQARA